MVASRGKGRDRAGAKEGAEGRRRLRELIADRPDEVAAYQQLGQSYLEEGEPEQARPILERGVEAARARGDSHAVSEMSGLLDLMG